MPLIQLDIKMLPMKVHFFLFMGGVAPMTAFLPTIAKQLGYSTFIFGVVYSILPIFSLIIKPVVGAIVDQFQVKKTIFLTFILLTGLSTFALMFVPEIPLETVAELHCHEVTYLNVCSNNTLSTSECDVQRVMKHKIEDLVNCELKCKNSDHFRNEMCSTWSFNNYCLNNNSVEQNKLESNNIYYNNDYVYLYASIVSNFTDHISNCFYFRISSFQLAFNTSEIVEHMPFCNTELISKCQIQCNSIAIMDLITPQTYEGSVLKLNQFWIFFFIISLFWISQAAIFSLGDSICFDQLSNKPNLYGKQRCWGAIGWGSFSIFAGWLVDIFSSSEVNKNYLPIYFLCLLVLLCNFFAATKLQISETKISTNICKDIGKLIMEVKVLGFLIWTIIFGICTAMIWQFLFWYLEDVASEYGCNTQAWIKTLQGLAMGVQCFGGELPLFFWSGWIIKRLGHLNCMSLVLGVFAFRFFAYSILNHPAWVLIIELTNGITFGLAYAVLVSYASVIALPGTESTMIGLAGGVFEGIGVSLGSLLGGFLYDIYGGAQTFAIFSYGSTFFCVLHLICQNLLKSNVKLSLPSYDFEEVQNNKSNFKETGFLGSSTVYASPNEAIHMLSDN